MSIRTLTVQLQQERVEQQRVQQFQSARSIPQEEVQLKAAKQTPFMVGTSSRTSTTNTPHEVPVQQQPATPKIGLKEREQETTYGVPGGIVARFGKNALKEPVLSKEPEEIITPETEPEPVLETPQEKEVDGSDSEETAQQQEQEQAVAEEEDEAARITIELQSH